MKIARLVQMMRPWGKRALLALGGTYLAYLLLVNLALAVGLLPHELDMRPSKVHVAYKSAWTWFPGRVHARELRVVGSDSSMQWQFNLDEVTVRISIWDVLHRQFTGSHVRAHGVVARLRSRLTPSEATQEVLSVLPPIDGLALESVIRPEPPPPPLTDEEYNLWAVRLEDIDAQGVHEVWFDGYRFLGEASALGRAFMLRPQRLLAVGPVVIDVTRGDMRLGPEVLTDGLTGHLLAEIAAFDPRTDPPGGALHFLTATAQGDGHVASLRFLNHYSPGASDPKLDGGAGAMHAELHLLSGVVAVPTRVSLDLADASVVAREHRFAASSKLTLVVEEAAGAPEGHLAVNLTGVDVRRARADTPLVRSPQIALAARAKKLDLTDDAFGDATVSIDVPQAVMPHLRALEPYLADSGFSARAGKVTVHAKATASFATGTGSGELGLMTEGAVVRVKDADFRGALTANVKLPLVDLRAKRAEFSGSRIELRDFGPTTERHDPYWWGRVELEKASASFGDAPSFRSGIAVQSKDGRPFLKVYGVKQEGAPPWLMNLVNLDDLRGVLAFAVAPNVVQVHDLHLKGGAFDVRGSYDKRGSDERGAALVTWGPFSVAIAVRNGKTDLKLLNPAELQQATASQSAL